MGGVLALRAALARPRWVTHLVLCATSGGLPMAELGAADWRAGFHSSLSHLPDWFATEQTDLSERLPDVSAPTLLLWGDADPFSPIAAGERLARRLPQARLHVIPGGDHDLGLLHADGVAPLIDAHLLNAHLTDGHLTDGHLIGDPAIAPP
jgi:pimeloyl-ACP methyl ester carboxylesterase